METKTQSQPRPRAQHAVWKDKPIVLIGLMGAGKSTVGRKLAKAIGWEFEDSDAAIEESAGCSISDMFQIHGEPMFRDLERRVITRLLSDKPIVLATGGGAWMQAPLREIIREKAITVWLHAELDVLLDRVSRKSHRPILEQGDKRSILQGLMEERYPIYAEADITVDSNAGPQDAVVKRVIAALKEYKLGVSNG